MIACNKIWEVQVKRDEIMRLFVWFLSGYFHSQYMHWRNIQNDIGNKSVPWNTLPRTSCSFNNHSSLWLHRHSIILLQNIYVSTNDGKWCTPFYEMQKFMSATLNAQFMQLLMSNFQGGKIIMRQQQKWWKSVVGKGEICIIFFVVQYKQKLTS